MCFAPRCRSIATDVLDTARTIRPRLRMSTQEARDPLRRVVEIN
jgi:hypothetical protein